MLRMAMKENTQTTLGLGPHDTAQIEQKDEELQGGLGEARKNRKELLDYLMHLKQIYSAHQQQYLDGHGTTVTLINMNNDFTKKV